ncbi:MAG: methyltransferase domain-containing protein [Polyangiaceae bacterium]|nr:methyltransferase domain-containing protein [Polyangiaceae bacterium]
MSLSERDLTERLLVDAGIGPGMRVLDVGCGRGEVSLLLSQLVGESGAVVAIDRDAHWLGVARERAREAGAANASFVVADMSDLPKELSGLDAAVGRRVLMYQADPVGAVRGVASAVRPGGLVVFQEHDASMVPASVARLPLHAQAWRGSGARWSAGANLHMGFDLWAVLGAAGLEVQQVRAEAIVQTPDARHPTAGIVRAILPRITGAGVATEAEIDVETLDARLEAELRGSGATYVGDMVFGAWARRPSAASGAPE